MKHRFLSLLLLSHFCLSCQRESADVEKLSLDEIRAEVLVNDRFIGTARLEKLRVELKESNRDAELLFQLGREELKLGNEVEAISLLEEARRNESHHEIQADIRFELAMALMRHAETMNCCARNHPDSCLFPIQGEGIHENSDPAREAREVFLELLREFDAKEDVKLEAIWLLNIAAMVLDEWPDGIPGEFQLPASTFESDGAFPRFQNRSVDAKTDSFDNAGGAVAEDFDLDGDLDLITSSMNLEDPIRYFRNEGHLGFTDVSEESGLSAIPGGLNLIHGDYDNDGWVDLYVLRGCFQGAFPNSLIRNQGDGTFVDVTKQAGLSSWGETLTACWIDYNNDGFLDLFVPTRKGASHLFHNDGDGTFHDVASRVGLAEFSLETNPLGAVTSDFNEDGYPDLFISLQNNENILFLNLTGKMFRRSQGNFSEPKRSFSCAVSDFNQDGHIDIVVAPWDRKPAAALAAFHFKVDSREQSLPALYLGNGKGDFESVANSYGLTTPWCAMAINVGDLNNDSFPEIYVGSGLFNYSDLVPNLLWSNRSGKRFHNVTTAANLGHLQKGHGITFGDFDRDGDLDIYQQVGGAFPGDRFFNCLWHNEGEPKGNWLILKLQGTRTNRQAIGARIRVEALLPGGKKKVAFRTVGEGGSFGGNPFEQFFGLETAESIESIQISWAGSGTVQILESIPVNQRLEVTEPDVK